MKKMSASGMCYFVKKIDFEEFSRQLKFALLNLEIRDVTINPYNDGSVIVIHDFAKTDDDFTLSHRMTKKITEKFGGTYSIE